MQMYKGYNILNKSVNRDNLCQRYDGQSENDALHF